jgi:hypothetical protein
MRPSVERSRDYIGFDRGFGDVAWAVQVPVNVPVNPSAATSPKKTAPEAPALKTGNDISLYAIPRTHLRSQA